MKVRVEYTVPSPTVSEVIEVGDVVNGKLNASQMRLVDEAAQRLGERFVVKFKTKKVKVRIVAV